MLLSSFISERAQGSHLVVKVVAVETSSAYHAVQGRHLVVGVWVDGWFSGSMGGSGQMTNN